METETETVRQTKTVRQGKAIRQKESQTNKGRKIDRETIRRKDRQTKITSPGGQ